MKHLALVLALVLGGCTPDPAVLLNAPPQLDGGHVYVDGQFAGVLKTTHNYRVGRFAARKEMAAPPRHEANLGIQRLPTGVHSLRIVKPGYSEYRGTFRNPTAHVEVFVPDHAARASGG